jgi:hypothetical protein
MKKFSTTKSTKLLGLIAAVILSCSPLNAQMVVQQWAQSYNSGNNDICEKMVMDNSGSVHVVGERTQNGGGGYPMQYYAKYSSNGTFLYQRFLNPACQNPNFRGCYALDVTVDNSGNAFVCGFLDSAFGYLKGYIVKYNSNGDSVMGMYAGLNDTLQHTMWSAIKLDNSGNIYVGGYNYTYPPYTGYYIVAKYSPAGSLLWVKRYRPAQYYSIGYYLNMELDNSGNIIIGSTMQKTSSYSSKDFHVVKFNNSGVFQWSATYNGPADNEDDFSDMALDGTGNVYIQGTTYVSPTNKEIACIKFNSATGGQEWVYRAGGTGTNFGDDKSKSIAVNSLNEIYITGMLFNTTTMEDGYLIKLNPAGNEVWRKLVISTGGSSSDMTEDVAVDNAGFIYTLSTMNGYSVNSQAVTRAYNSAGDSLWSASYTDPVQGLSAKYIFMKSGSIAVACDQLNTTSKDVSLIKYSHTTAVNNISSEIPAAFSLKQNYPNPFNPLTNINFSLPSAGFVRVTVFDVTGREIEKLVNEQLSAGTYNVSFDASKHSSGIYFYKLETEKFSDVKKMILVK